MPLLAAIPSGATRHRRLAALGLALACACSEPPPETAAAPEDERPAVAPGTGDRRFALADFVKPRMDAAGGLDPYLAPLLYLEADGTGAGLPGALELDATGRLRVDAERPAVYWTDRRVSLGRHSLRQTSFLWFRSVGGRDAAPQGVRVTHDTRGFPVIFEILAGQGDTPLLFVSRSLEERAAASFGAPLEGRRYVVEGDAPLRLAAVVENGAMPMGPYVYLTGDAPDVADLHCRCSPTQADEIRAAVEYELLPLALLEGVWPAAARDAPAFAPPHVLAERLRLPDDL